MLSPALVLAFGRHARLVWQPPSSAIPRCLVAIFLDPFVVPPLELLRIPPARKAEHQHGHSPQPPQFEFLYCLTHSGGQVPQHAILLFVE
jgi:hypothetical protein